MRLSRLGRRKSEVRKGCPDRETDYRIPQPSREFSEGTGAAGFG
jgi:hypothetical protein